MRFLFVCCLFGLSYSYPQGAPNETCSQTNLDLIPQHGKESQPRSTNPYVVTISKNYYTKENDIITVNIKGKTDATQIRGFAVGVLNANKQWIGQWQQDSITHMIEACPVATHQDKNDKPEVNLTWYAPRNPSGVTQEVKFKVTVLKTGYTFWVNPDFVIQQRTATKLQGRANPFIFRRQF